MNYSFFNRQGTFEATSFDFHADQWSSKVTNKIKLPAQFEFEITGRYQSEVTSVQAIFASNLFADIGLRKKIGTGKAVLNLSIRDLFASRVRESETESETPQANFHLFNSSQRGRFIVLGFSYGFGKGEAMEFSGQRRRR